MIYLKFQQFRNEVSETTGSTPDSRSHSSTHPWRHWDSVPNTVHYPSLRGGEIVPLQPLLLNAEWTPITCKACLFNAYFQITPESKFFPWHLALSECCCVLRCCPVLCCVQYIPFFVLNLLLWRLHLAGLCSTCAGQLLLFLNNSIIIHLNLNPRIHRCVRSCTH